MQNAFIESFNGRLRDELLNETLFRSLPHARAGSKPGAPTTIPTAALPARLADPSHLRSRPAVRCASLTDGSATRTAATTAQQGNIERQTPITLG